MNGRTVAQILLVLVIAAGAVALGTSAYNAGVTAGLLESGQVVVTPGGQPVNPGPYVGSGWGWGGHGHGFSFVGFLGTVLLFFLFIGLVRAAIGPRHRGWGPGGHGGPGGDHWRGSPWEQRAREAHDAWHRDATRTDPDRASGEPSGT